MTRKKQSPASPWAKKKAASRSLNPDEEWAANLAARILGDCHPWQRDAVVDQSTLISYLVGRGGAKTTSMRARGMLKSTSIRKGIIVYVANSRQHAEELMWGPLKNACEAYGIMDDMIFLDGKLRMTCKRTGATYRMFGVEDKKDADKLRGQPYDEFQADEVGGMGAELLDYMLEQCVIPRLGERHGSIVIGSTPPPLGRGVFYDATRYGAVNEDGEPIHRPYSERQRPEFKDWIGWSSHAWNMTQVYNLPNARKLYEALVLNWEKALVTKARKKWADDNPVWMREYLGQWAADHTDRVFKYRSHVDGKEWNQWDPFGAHPLEGISALKAAIAALPKDVGTWHYVVAMDAGSRDPFACNVYAFAPADALRRVIHVFCFEKTGMYAKTIAELLIGPDLNHSKPAGVFGVIGWPDATVFDSDQNQIDELGNVYGVRCKKAERKADYKFGAIEGVNGDFIEGRIKVLKGSALEIQLGLLQWKVDEYGMLREDKSQANHSTDTLIIGRIAIAELFDGGAISEEAPNPVYVDPMRLDVGEARESDLDSLLAEPEYDESWGAL